MDYSKLIPDKNFIESKKFNGFDYLTIFTEDWKKQFTEKYGEDYSMLRNMIEIYMFKAINEYNDMIDFKDKFKINLLH